MTTLLDLFFILANVAVIAAGIRNRVNLGVAVYLGAYLVFVLIGHAVFAFESESDYNFSYYLLTHVASLLFIALIVLLSSRDMQRNVSYLRTIKAFTPSVISAAIAVWILFEIYLFTKYGNSGQLDLNGLEVSEESPYDYLDSSAASIFNCLANGAALALVSRLSVEPAFSRNIITISLFVTYLLFSLALTTATVGGRRMVLILAFTFVIVRFMNSKQPLGSFLKRQLHSVIVPMILVLSLAWYYQEIRNNVSAPTVTSLLSSQDISDKLNGIALLLTPGTSNDYFSAASGSEIINRSGPFDFFYQILEGRYESGLSTDGELTIYSIRTVVPKVLDPQKPLNSPERIIGSRFGIKQPGGDFTEADYSKTVLAFLVADFGWVGVPLASIAIAYSLKLAVSVLAVVPRDSIVALGCLGVMFELIGMIESSLVSLLASLRMLVLVVVVGFIIETVRGVRGTCK